MHATKVGHRLTQTIGIAWVISHNGLVQWAGYNYFLMLRFMWFLRAGNHVTSQHFAPFCAWRVSDTGTGLLAARPSLGPPKRAFQIDQTWSNHWPFQVPQLGQFCVSGVLSLMTPPMEANCGSTGTRTLDGICAVQYMCKLYTVFTQGNMI